jgi:DNA primase
MTIYQLVFGVDQGQVNCCFHDDTRASSGISNIGQFNCFTCGAKAHSPVSFTAKYFGIGQDRAKRITEALKRVQKYNYKQHPVEPNQRAYLNRCGIEDKIIDKYFFSSAVHKLIYKHTWNGMNIGYTWFNDPSLAAYNAGAPKYKYDKNNIGGIVTPYDIAERYNTLIIAEGEKDMLTALSKDIPNVVAKVGGAKTYIMGGRNFENKNIIIVYDCDEWGREGAEQDATLLTERFNCKVKVIDLGLQDKEDLNDYFIKYNHTKQDFESLIKATPIFVPKPKAPEDKLQQFVSNLSDDELNKLKNIIENKKGE